MSGARINWLSRSGFFFDRAAQLLQVGALNRFDAHEPPLSVLTGLEFDALTPVDQANAVAQMAVFARVEPSHKRRLVELLKAQASSQLSGVLSTSGWGQQLTAETLLRAKVLCSAAETQQHRTQLCGAHGDLLMIGVGMNNVHALNTTGICPDA